jgi:hypothetical protein
MEANKSGYRQYFRLETEAEFANQPEFVPRVWEFLAKVTVLQASQMCR